MKIINLIGEPSAGKSTIAAELFAKMKKAGYNVELVTEYAKDMVWENRNEMFSHQDYIFAKQNRRLARLNGKVDYVITDAPLILSLYYLDKSNTPLSFAPFIKDVVSQYDNDYFFIKRTHKYESIGRYQTEEEAKIISKDLLNLLIENNVDFTILHSDEEVAEQILKKIENQGFNHEINH